MAVRRQDFSAESMILRWPRRNKKWSEKIWPFKLKICLPLFLYFLIQAKLSEPSYTSMKSLANSHTNSRIGLLCDFYNLQTSYWLMYMTQGMYDAYIQSLSVANNLVKTNYLSIWQLSIIRWYNNARIITYWPDQGGGVTSKLLWIHITEQLDNLWYCPQVW